jgi:hypothetical protein
MRHRWSWSWWQTARNLVHVERCGRCGIVRKREQRHWRYRWSDGAWHREAADPCAGDKAKDDRQRELFAGEVKA